MLNPRLASVDRSLDDPVGTELPRHGLTRVVAILGLTLALLGGAPRPGLAALSDDFADGDDTTPLWEHFEPDLNITCTGAGAPAPCCTGPSTGSCSASFDASSGSYAISVDATGDPTNPPRAGSHREQESFTDVLVSVDLLAWDNIDRHTYGIGARLSGAAGATRDGYALIYRPDGGGLSSLSLIQLDAGVSSDLASAPASLSPGQAYRLVLSVAGASPARVRGYVYTLSDLHVPVAALDYIDVDSPILTSGFTGVLIGDDSITASQDVSATFDDFFARDHVFDSDGDGASDAEEIDTETFGPPRSIYDFDPLANWEQEVATGDLDLDGNPDVLISAWNGTQVLAWIENRLDQPSKDFGAALSLATPPVERAYDVIEFDLDGDGDLDVVATGPSLRWYENRLNEPSADFAAAIALAGYTFALQVGDIDGDGDGDIVAREGPDVKWFENRLDEASADFAPGAIVGSPDPFDAGYVHETALADFNGDGDLDVAFATNSMLYIGWFENSTKGPNTSFPTEHVINPLVGTYPAYKLETVDLDGDGDTDLLATDPGNGAVMYYENRLDEPSPSFSQALYRGTGLNSTAETTTMDVDGDGDLDIVATGDPLLWLENRLDGSPADLVLHAYLSNVPSWGISAADLDGDGDLDLVTTANEDVIWHENRGSHTNSDPYDPDSDDDGLEDGFELDNGFDPLDPDENSNGIPDGEDDADADGLDNMAEAANGTDPTNPDTDGDGFSDGDEVAAGSDPLDPFDTPLTVVPVPGLTGAAALLLAAQLLLLGVRRSRTRGA